MNRARLAALAALIAGAAHAQADALPRPAVLFNYQGVVSGVIAGGSRHIATYVHTLSFGVQAPISDAWSWTVQGASTAGQDLSSRAIGDVAGVQGPFNTGDGLWLYEAKVSWATKAAGVQLGRLSAGDAMPGVGGVDQFVNSAFSSNGGAISVNDPGRATTPASSWGATGHADVGNLDLRGGLFLSDPRRFALDKHGVDLTFAPRHGVLSFAEAVAPVTHGLRLGLGAFGDSRRIDTFDGRSVRGDAGGYLWLEKPAPDDGEAVSGFAMVQAMPRADRNLQPLFLMGGVTWQGFLPGRPDDALSLGATAGRFSARSGLRGWENLIEADYRLRLTDRLAARPDLQWVMTPSGKSGGRNALVLGVQLEATL